ncbi:hypothetical protein A3D55_00725 [Candidatus Jorgensenbacteria bacterium RIFCSPHIGHO2_02_FULL_45_20]|uniref:Uncharacterized protein n=1 Tax=Candidatus Jorgensenbacteria bacterium RIFCSPHIGHO2_02_FULL_45_20 TaxID=1798470 RepID=A0A1F6BNG1_9BACT|nr:MAG: hypothetical protein A3D55_00725 [Candidatus Jorgensenbacteria bacterium RIFCSPHIGHO2_02_FULL_45_20]
MYKYVDEQKWLEAGKHQDWYLRTREDYKRPLEQAEKGGRETNNRVCLEKQRRLFYRVGTPGVKQNSASRNFLKPIGFNTSATVKLSFSRPLSRSSPGEIKI